MAPLWTIASIPRPRFGLRLKATNRNLVGDTVLAADE
jgi:hypothetical protein